MFWKKEIQPSEFKSFFLKLCIFWGFSIGLYLIYQIGNILVLLWLALFLNMLFAPFLNQMNRYKIKDTLWIFVIYGVIACIIFLMFFSILPIFIKQILALLDMIGKNVSIWMDIYKTSGIEWFGFPKFVELFLEQLDISQILNAIKENISTIGSFAGKNLQNFVTSWAGIFASVTGALINFIFVFVFSFFIALERKEIRTFFYKIIPQKTALYLLNKEDRIITSLYNWLKWQMILGVSIFIITFIGLLFLRIFWIEIEETFTLAMIAGLMEFVPYVWPILALLPALAIWLGMWWEATLAILILYIIIQQVENNVLVPYVMWKTLSLSPFSVLIAMTIGWSLFGILGIIISVPVVAVIQIFLWDYLNKK